MGYRRGCAPRPCPGLSWAVRQGSVHTCLCVHALVCAFPSLAMHTCASSFPALCGRPLEPLPLTEAPPSPWGSGTSVASSHGTFLVDALLCAVHSHHCPRRPSLSAGVTVHGGHCPWGSLSTVAVTVRSVTVRGGHCPRRSLSAAVSVRGGHCPWPSLSAAVTVHGRHCPRQSGSTTLPCSPD